MWLSSNDASCILRMGVDTIGGYLNKIVENVYTNVNFCFGSNIPYHFFFVGLQMSVLKALSSKAFSIQNLRSKMVSLVWEVGIFSP